MLYAGGKFYENAAEYPMREHVVNASGDDAFSSIPIPPMAGKAHSSAIFLPSASHSRKSIITIRSISVLSMWSAVEIVRPRPMGGATLSAQSGFRMD
jgi:hypothetical protein